MNDQANSLRKLVENSTTEKKETKVISVVSGKGGVGKSNFSLNFAIGLSQAGYRVALFDLDIGMANVDILMGLSTPYNIVDMIENELSIWDIIQTGPEDIHFISGGSGFTNIFKLNEVKFNRFIQQMEHLQNKFDYIILDMGAGVTETSLKFILSSHESILVTTPEPTSITDAYAMLKYLHKQNSELPCKVLINRIESDKEGISTGDNLKRGVRQFLNKEITIQGYLPNDKIVLKAVKTQKPFLLLDPNGKMSKAFNKIVSNYTGESKIVDKPMFNTFISKFKRFFKES